MSAAASRSRRGDAERRDVPEGVTLVGNALEKEKSKLRGGGDPSRWSDEKSGRAGSGQAWDGAHGDPRHEQAVLRRREEGSFGDGRPC
uniref:Uncharacterized protein n=1 Tax=Oryza meridionalis TaxID=40149 RepID=A0A0E0CJB0_9ORYZ